TDDLESGGRVEDRIEQCRVREVAGLNVLRDRDRIRPRRRRPNRCREEKKQQPGPPFVFSEAGRLPVRPVQSSSMANLVFFGLGLMGYPMARNLLRAGHHVALWSHTAQKARQLAADEKGACCQTPAEVALQSDCIFLCVGNTGMARKVILGENGIIEGA